MDSNPQHWTRNTAPKSLLSPLTDPVTVEYRDETNTPVSYTIPPYKIMTYPTYLADFLIRHLATAVVDDRKLGFVSPEKLKEIVHEIEVTV